MAPWAAGVSATMAVLHGISITSDYPYDLRHIMVLYGISITCEVTEVAMKFEVHLSFGQVTWHQHLSEPDCLLIRAE